jgi:hypothetical protein
MRIDRVLAPVALVASLAGVARAADGRTCGIVHKTVAVSGRNDEWTSADIKISPGDRVLVVAAGKVKVGAFIGEVNADGNNPANTNSLGRLDMKVGTGTVIPVGKRWFGGSDEPGTVKFRVHDTSYTDNGGAFEVDVIVIPPNAIPEPIKVAAQ